MNNEFRYPTPDEMIALTAAAHRNRSRHMMLLLLWGIRAVKSLAGHRPVSATGNVSHA